MSRSRSTALGVLLPTGIWLAWGAVATSVGFGAVQLVGSQVTDRAATPLSQRDVRAAVAALPAASPTLRPMSPAPARPGPTPPTTSRQPHPPRRSTATTRPPKTGVGSANTGRTGTFVADGGVVAVSCTGSTIRLRYANPSNGYQTSVTATGPKVVRVTFENPGGSAPVSLTCVHGVPARQRGWDGDHQPAGDH